jgi:hypothetical protein
LSFLSSQGDSNSALEQLCDLYTAGITRNKHGDQFSLFPFSLSSLQKSHITLMCNARPLGLHVAVHYQWCSTFFFAYHHILIWFQYLVIIYINFKLN